MIKMDILEMLMCHCTPIDTSSQRGYIKRLKTITFSERDKLEDYLVL